MLLEGRYQSPDSPVRVVRPAEVMDDLLATVFTVRQYLLVAVALVGAATLATIALATTNRETAVLAIPFLTTLLLLRRGAGDRRTWLATGAALAAFLLPWLGLRLWLGFDGDAPPPAVPFWVEPDETNAEVNR